MRAAKASTAPSAEPEQQLWRGSFSPKAMIGCWFWAGLISIVAIALCFFIPPPIPLIAAAIIVPLAWLLPAMYLLYERLSVDYTLTNQRFMHKTGLLRRVSNRIEVIDIDDVTYEQGLIERLFGVGTIKLLSSDVSDPKVLLRGIEDVQRVATMIDNARREERRKRGLYMEAV
jgi:membrane protein YdbS with pleckstrin-like domain